MQQFFRTRARRIAAVALLLALVGGTGVAIATWGGSSSNPGNALVAGTIGAAGGVNATDGGGVCATVNVSWTAGAGATGYRVEAKTANGAYVVRNADVGNVTNWADTGGGFTNREVTYRITALYAGSSWEGTPAVDSTPLTCNVGEVDDLAATNACNDTDLTWSAATGATVYDVWRKVGAGAWTEIVTDQAGLTYSDPTVHAAGSTVQYYIVPGSAAGAGNNGNSGNTASIANWDTFKVNSVVVNNTGTANSVNLNDNIVVTFNKAALNTTPSGTNSTSIYIQRNATGGTRGLYLSAGTPATASSAIGWFRFTANITGTSRVVTGATAWSAGDTVWTWTRNNATAYAFGTPTYSTWTTGTSAANPARIKCSDNVGTLTTSTPTVSGWF